MIPSLNHLILEVYQVSSMRTTLTTLTFICLTVWSLGQEHQSVQDTVPVETDVIEVESIQSTPVRLEEISNSSRKKEKLDSYKEAQYEKAAREQLNAQFDKYVTEYQMATQKSESGDALIDALNLKPDDIGVLDELMSYYEIMGDHASMKQTAKKMFASKKYHTDILSYQENVIRSLDAGTVLITNGEWDTYPLLGKLALEHKDITVVNIQLLSDTKYRSERLKEKGLMVPSNMNNGVANFIQQLYGLNPNHAFHLGLTVDKAVLKQLKSQLHLAGLSFKLGGMTSAQTVVDTFEDDVNMSFLKRSNAPAEVRKLNLNYLPMLAAVHKKYKEDGDAKKAKDVKVKMTKLAQQAGRSDVLEKLK